MKDTINVGLIGYGASARTFHVPVILATPTLRLKTIVARSGNDTSRPPPTTAVVREFDDLLRDDQLDLVVIATPNSSHFELARRSLLANKHVVIEKPFTTSSIDALRLIELAEQKGLVLSAHQNRRWDGDFLTVQELLGKKHLGRLTAFESRFDRFRNHPKPGAWREQRQLGAGVFFDIGSHLIDQAVILFGAPSSVIADIRLQREFAQVDDYFDVMLNYGKFAATLKAGMLVKNPTPRFCLQGDRGTYIKYGTDPQENALKQGDSPTHPAWGREPESAWGTLSTKYQGLHSETRVETLPGCYQTYYQNIADAISGNASLAVTARQALMTIRIIELAIQSSQQKCIVPFNSE